MSKYLQQRDMVLFNSKPGKPSSKTHNSPVIASMYWLVMYAYFYFCSLKFSLLPHADLRPSAEEAIQKMQGQVIGQQAVRISWSKNPGQVKTFVVI